MRSIEDICRPNLLEKIEEVPLGNESNNRKEPLMIRSFIHSNSLQNFNNNNNKINKNNNINNNINNNLLNKEKKVSKVSILMDRQNNKNVMFIPVNKKNE